MYEPILPSLAIVRSRISPEAWSARVEAARHAEGAMLAIKKHVDAGTTLNDAIRRAVPSSRRSWVMRNWKAYVRDGFEALIDRRTPREPVLSRACAGLIQAAREADSNVTVARVLEILRGQKLKDLPSPSTIRLHFARVDARTRYAKKKQEAAQKVEELPFAGGELLRAAELETGAIAALTDEVVALAEEATEASVGQTPVRDVADRDAHGHFTAAYNRKRRRKRGEQIASYLRPAEEKAQGRVRSWPRFVHERRETLEPKVAMLTLAPLVAGTKGWDALRAPEVAGLLPLTGFAYMPSTLAKMTSALAISGAGPRLLEAMGKNWHRVAQAHWAEPGAMAALYVDNHAKEVWTSLFTLSGKVSHLSRVMPCITTTYVHTGAGTPLVASVQSGAAPLAPRLVQLVEEAEAKLDGVVRRAVIIDAEGSTFDILESFAKKKRVIVTPLRRSRAPGLELTYSAGSYFRPYRDNDELRCASATLTHKSSGRTLELGALLVRREHREDDTVLLTTGLSLGMEGRELADLYFARWPIQENAFKEGAAVGLNEHRGNCGQMVANVAVVTELERLDSRVKVEKGKRRELGVAKAGLEQTLARASREHQRTVSSLATRRGRLDTLVAAGRREGKQLGQTAVEHQKALVRAEAAQKALNAAQQDLERNLADAANLDASLEKATARREKLASQRSIRQLDVALDMVLTAAKLTCALLITFAIREYLPAMPMTPQTFASRLFGVRGRREQRPDEELTVFYENPRDPEVNAVLADACRRLNRRGLVRGGRRLRYAVEQQGESS
jgi:hypothetical protein